MGKERERNLGDVVDEKSAGGVSIEGGNDGPEALLPCRVPDLGTHSLVTDLCHKQSEALTTE